MDYSIHERLVQLEKTYRMCTVICVLNFITMVGVLMAVMMAGVTYYTAHRQ